jgi:hypothetical protein
MSLIQPVQPLRGIRLASPATAVALLVAGLGLSGCDRAAQGYPSLEPMDKLLAEADSAFSGPIP